MSKGEVDIVCNFLSAQQFVHNVVDAINATDNLTLEVFRALLHANKSCFFQGTFI